MTEETGFLETVKRKYVGKWIGLKDNVVVVSGTHDQVLRELREKKVDGAYVFYSPTEDEKEYGFLFPVCKWSSVSKTSLKDISLNHKESQYDFRHETYSQQAHGGVCCRQ